MGKCYCPDAKLRYGEPALCEYCAEERGRRKERERIVTMIQSLFNPWTQRECQGASIRQALEDIVDRIKERS